MTQGQRLAIEGALERGHLWAKVSNGKYWVLRRNGKTKTKKIVPDYFSIPVKCGLRTCTRISDQSFVATTFDDNWRDAHFIVCDRNPINNLTPRQAAQPTIGGTL
jgi:predicted type IV restriction endonuclease